MFAWKVNCAFLLPYSVRTYGLTSEYIVRHFPSEPFSTMANKKLFCGVSWEEVCLKHSIGSSKHVEGLELKEAQEKYCRFQGSTMKKARDKHYILKRLLCKAYCLE